jgi:phage terminase small subunit
MSRPRKPSVIHEISGAYKKNPNRRTKGELAPLAGIGSAPANLATDFESVWDEIVSNVCPGVLGNSDRFHLEILCRLVCQFRERPEDMTAGKLGLMGTMLGKFGMNPVDRMRLAAPNDEEPSEDDKYF